MMNASDPKPGRSYDEHFEAKIARLADATEDIALPRGLEARVFSALARRTREGRWDAVWRTCRRGAIVALVAAVASGIFAFWDHRHVEVALKSAATQSALQSDAPPFDSTIGEGP